MEAKETDKEVYSPHYDCHNYGHSRAGKIMAGLIVVAAGAIWLAKKMGAMIPDWVFTWQMLLIAFGLFMGAKHGFKRWGWLLPVAVGVVFLIDDFNPNISLRRYIGPILLILGGLIIIFKPRRTFKYSHHRHREKWECYTKKKYGNISADESSEDMIDASSVFASIKKNVISKNFRGGEINCVFGGAEINLSQADITGTVVLEVNQVFGGTRIIVPSNWTVQPEISAVAGGMEDKRVNTQAADPNKILILKGSTVFGGIEITSY